MYLEIRRISKIRHIIPTNVAEKLVNSFVLTKLDYCNSLLSNISKDKIHRLQVVQNNAARMVLKKNRYSSASSLLQELHWLPVDRRIQYKVSTIVYKSLNNVGPNYIRNLLNLYIPNRNLRSLKDQCRLTVARPLRRIGLQSFEYSAPLFWNSLPENIRSSPSIEMFKSRLKTHLFTRVM